MKYTKSVLTKSQKKSLTKKYTEGFNQYTIKLDIRYDDECGNKHNTFALTATIHEGHGFYTDRKFVSGGCCHDEIAKQFPNFAKYIKWHGTTSDGPLYYVANTMYHAQDTDYNGLKKGEYGSYRRKVMGDIKKDGQLVALYTSGTIYGNKKNNGNLSKSSEKELDKVVDFTASLKPSISYFIEDEPQAYSLSEGKEPDLEAARRCAIWPDATLEQLLDKEALEARLPLLMKEFQSDMEELGFVY